jgi:YbbR domain-containing protein
MAEMTPSKMLEAGVTVKLLSVLVAALLWLTVMMERPAETKILVPVMAEHVPAGLSLAAPSPAKVEITVSGPRILLLMLPLSGLSCRMDMSATQAGTILYVLRQSSVQLPDRGLQVVRVAPAAVSVSLAKITAR